MLARCLRFVFCSSLSLNVVLCLAPGLCPSFLCPCAAFLCVCAPSLCVSASCPCVCVALCVSLRRISVCVRSVSVCLGQLSVSLRSPLCVIAPRFCACALRLYLFPPKFCGLAPPSMYSRFSLLGFSPRSLSSPASGCVFVYACALVCGFFFSCNVLLQIILVCKTII